MTRDHNYEVSISWTGNRGSGTSTYLAYSRNHELRCENKPQISCSSDPAFLGDPTRYNPEDLLVGAISACHMLWYLHLCAKKKVVVTNYTDSASGTMVEHEDGSGEFREVRLKPQVVISAISDFVTARDLHNEVHRFCCLARSVNFEIRCEPSVTVEGR